MKALYTTSVANCGGPEFWLKILTFKTWSNSVNVASMNSYSYHMYFKESVGLSLITNSITVITSTVCHCLQQYISILLPKSIATYDLHSISYSIKYQIFILIHNFRSSRLAVHCEVSAAYRVRRSPMRAYNNSWCILETKRRTTPW